MTTETEPIDPNRAVDYLIAVAGKHAKAKAERIYIEQYRKTKKALLMNLCDAKAVTAKEQFAYSHPEYLELLEGLRAAVEVEETLKFKIVAAQLRVEVWRSQNANNRSLDRATQ